MPTPTYTPLAETTLSASALQVEFTSIDQSYRDLVLVVTGTATASTGETLIFNNDTTSTNYNHVWMAGNGSSTWSGTANNNQTVNMFAFDTGTNVAVEIIEIMDYSATDKHKSAIIRYNQAANGVEADILRWSNTAAITSITFKTGAYFAAGTTFGLYGIVV